jgi:lipoprotein-anchoring transpeptidase ErfK/SrfK
MRQRFGLIWTISLAIFILAAAILAWRQTHAGAPSLKPAPGVLTAQWWPPAGRVAGTRLRLWLTVPLPTTATRVSTALRVRGASRPHIVAAGPDRFEVAPPAGGWPESRRIQFTLRLKTLYPDLPNLTASSRDTIATDDHTIVVNLTHQLMQVYQGDRLVRTMPVSTGAAPGYETPSGTFWIWRRVRVDHMRGGSPGSPGAYDVPHVPFAQYIYGGIAIHGAYWSRAFGVPRSHGCIQLATRTFNPDKAGVPEDAGWLWHWARLGDPVIVTGSTPARPESPSPYPHRMP